MAEVLEECRLEVAKDQLSALQVLIILLDKEQGLKTSPGGRDHCKHLGVNGTEE